MTWCVCSLVGLCLDLPQSVAKGDKEIAKRAVTAMKALSTRSSKRNGFSATGLVNGSHDVVSRPARPTQSYDTSVVIVRSGRRYILKEKVRKHQKCIHDFCAFLLDNFSMARCTCIVL